MAQGEAGGMEQGHMHRNELLSVFKARGRIVIVGASLAGLTAAETLRAEGFTTATRREVIHVRRRRGSSTGTLYTSRTGAA
jgi:monoamine oxidase